VQNCSSFLQASARSVIPSHADALSGKHPGDSLLRGDGKAITDMAEVISKKITKNLLPDAVPHVVYFGIHSRIMVELRDGRYGASRDHDKIGAKFNTIHYALYNAIAKLGLTRLGPYYSYAQDIHLLIKLARDLHRCNKGITDSARKGKRPRGE
jgi:hypothetical protein